MTPDPLERLDVFPYRHRVRDVMASPAVAAPPAISLEEAARRMRSAQVSALVLLGADGSAHGVLTERDIVAAVASEGAAGLACPAAARMSRPVLTVPADAFVHVAIGRMVRHGIRHLVVTESDGTVIGVVSARGLLRLRSGQALLLGDEVGAAADGVALQAAHARLPALLDGLLRERLTALDAAAVASGLLRAVTARATAIAEAELGPAPAPYAVMVLGSAGRGESLLAADQDNAIVHAGTGRDDPWYAALGTRMAELLDTAGIALCKGGVMAARPGWRRPLDGWKTTVATWIDQPSETNLLNVDIFFDLVAVYGQVELAERLRREAISAAAAAPMFLRMLAESVSLAGSALTPFGRFRRQEGRVDLKRGGLLPLVGAARLLALGSAAAARSTPDRLDAAVVAGRLDGDDADRLKAAFALLLHEVLAQQLIDLPAGRPAGSGVEVDRLSRGHRAALKQALSAAEIIPDLLHAALSA